MAARTPNFLTEAVHGFPHAFQANSVVLNRVGNNRTLPDPLQFVFHLSLHHSTLRNLTTYSFISSSSTALQTFVGSWPPRFRNHFYTLRRTPWKRDQSVARPQPTHRTTQIQNKRTQISMPRVGFEPTISAFERVKTGSFLRQRGHCDRPNY
jgi:hypothetical protein